MYRFTYSFHTNKFSILHMMFQQAQRLSIIHTLTRILITLTLLKIIHLSTLNLNYL